LKYSNYETNKKESSANDSCQFYFDFFNYRPAYDPEYCFWGGTKGRFNWSKPQIAGNPFDAATGKKKFLQENSVQSHYQLIFCSNLLWAAAGTQSPGVW